MKSITKNEGAAPARSEQEFVPPPVDVYENDKEFLLVADLPGIPQDGAAITLEHDHLVVQAKTNGRAYKRELVVPPSVDAGQVSAQMKAGVLTVHLPKRAPYQPRQVPVRAG
jgi:HSP20 family molecular chaperone IbpA